MTANNNSTSSLCNGIKIEHCSIGDPTNPPVLLIRGYSESMVTWAPFDEKIANCGFHVIKFDNRDMGLTQRFDNIIASDGGEPTFAYTINDMADDAVAVLDHYGISKAHVIGSSMGGLITQVVGTRHPERCITLTLIMTSYNIRAATGAAAAKQENKAFFAKLDKFTYLKEGSTLEEHINNCLILHEIIGVDPVYPQLSKENRETIKQNTTVEYERNGIDYESAGSDRQMLAINAFDGLEAEAHIRRLESIQIPTVVLHGLYDSLIPVEMGRQLASKIPACRIVEYVGNHYYGNHPDVFNFIINAITDHISRYSKT